MNFQSRLRNFWFEMMMLIKEVIIGTEWINVYLILTYKSNPFHDKCGKIIGARKIQNIGVTIIFIAIASSVETHAK